MFGGPGFGLLQRQRRLRAAIVLVRVDVEDVLAGPREGSSFCVRAGLVRGSFCLGDSWEGAHSASRDCWRPVPQMSTSQVVSVRDSMMCCDAFVARGG